MKADALLKNELKLILEVFTTAGYSEQRAASILVGILHGNAAYWIKKHCPEDRIDELFRWPCISVQKQKG